MERSNLTNEYQKAVESEQEEQAYLEKSLMEIAMLEQDLLNDPQFKQDWNQQDPEASRNKIIEIDIQLRIMTSSGKGSLPPRQKNEPSISERVVTAAGGGDRPITSGNMDKFLKGYDPNKYQSIFAWVCDEFDRLSESELKRGFREIFAIVKRSRESPIADWAEHFYLPIWNRLIHMELQVKTSFLKEHWWIMEVKLATLMWAMNIPPQEKKSWMIMLRYRQDVKAVEVLKTFIGYLMKQDKIAISSEEQATFPEPPTILLDGIVL